MAAVYFLVAAMLFAPTVIFAVYLWLLGVKVVNAGMFPPPGLRVIRNTTVITGSAALRRGRRLKIVAVCLAIAFGLLCLMFWRLVRVLNGTGA